MISSDGGHGSEGVNAPSPGLPTCNATGLLPSRAVERRAEGAGITPRSVPIVCQGRYRASELLPQSEFVLAVRGDTLTSRRLADAMAYGAISILVADEIYEMGLPFQ